MRWWGLAALLALAACDDEPAANAVDDCGDLIAQCPAGSNPLVGIQAEDACSASAGGIVSNAMGEATAQCLGAGSCRVLCQFAVPCRCGVASVSSAGVICQDCEGAASCGNGVCEGGESPENCAIDCGAVCEAGELRCDGQTLQECNLQLRWDDLPCGAGDVCIDDAEGARCERDPGIIGGDDMGPGGDDMGPPPVDGRIIPGDGVWPDVQPAVRGRSPRQMVETALPGIIQGGLGNALADIGGHLHWRLVPDADQVEAIGTRGTVIADFAGVPVEPVEFTADAAQFCADHGACFNTPPREDCEAFVAEQLEVWGSSILQCMADLIRAREMEPTACNVLFTGVGCDGRAFIHPDRTELGGFPSRLAGDRLIGFNMQVADAGVMVELARRAADTFEPLGEFRLRTTPNAITLSADGRVAGYIASTIDEALVIWDMDAGERRPILPISGGQTVSIALGSDGQVLVAHRTDTGVEVEDDTLSVWNVADQQRIFSIQRPDRDRFTQIAISPDGRTLAAALRPSNDVEIWDLVAREKRHTLSFMAETIVDTLDFSQDGQLLAVTYTNFDRALTIWDVAGGQRLYTRAASNARFSPDGRILVIPEALVREGFIILADP